jgi:hypothetical protein
MNVRKPKRCRPQDCAACSAAAAELASYLKRNTALNGHGIDAMAQSCAATYRRHAAVRKWFGKLIKRHRDSSRQKDKRFAQRTPLANMKLLARQLDKLIEKVTNAGERHSAERLELERSRAVLLAKMTAEREQPSQKQEVHADPETELTLMAGSLWLEAEKERGSALTAWEDARLKAARTRRKGLAKELIEQQAVDARMRFLAARETYDVATYFAFGDEPGQRHVENSPRYLIDHLETKADAPMRVVVGALLAIGTRPVEVVRVMTKARGRKVDAGQLRRLIRALRSR